MRFFIIKTGISTCAYVVFPFRHKQKVRYPPTSPISSHFWMSSIFHFRKRRYELRCYVEHRREQGNVNIVLEFAKSDMHHHLTDVTLM